MYSKIIAGTMTWGSWGKQLTKSEMAALMHHCLESGISTFDHADIYGGYTNEADFGKAFKHSQISREKIQLISKCGIQYVCESRDNKVKHYDYSKEYIIWSLENSLRNLETEYLDLFLLHRPSPLMRAEEIAEAIIALKDSGKIRTFGVSNFSPSQIAMIEKVIPVEANQVEFSLTADGAMYDGTLDDIITNQRLAMAWSPLGSYFREDNEQTERIKAQIREFEKKYKADASQLLLAWILRHPCKIHPVVGTTDPGRLKNAMKAVELQLELEDWFILLTASQGHKVP
ncbi:MAG: aldo/keto reductase [Eudoraea sp.]|nr:aldo/keto reductase [Eudoraea sp.]